MAYAVMSRKFLQYENELSVERMEICVDAASDLPTANSIAGCKIAMGPSPGTCPPGISTA